MIRSYKLNHSINQNKQDKILDLLKEYRKTAIKIAKIQWKEFFKNKQFNKNLDIKFIKTKLSARYLQTNQYQVVGQLDSYLANRQNDFTDYLKNTKLDENRKIKLLFINKYKKWYYNDIKMKKEKIDIETIKIARKIIKNIFKNNKKPNLKYCNLALDEKVIKISKNGIKEIIKTKKVINLDKKKNKQFISKTYKIKNNIKETSFDYWLKLSTLEKPILLPIKSNDYFENVDGNIKNFIQMNYKNDKIDICLIKDIDKKTYIPKTDKIALDLGLNNLFATNNGDLFGRNFSQLLKKYDKIVTKLAKNRQKQKLKTSSKKYKKIRDKIRAYLKNEINRVLNNIIKTYKPKEVVIERLNFQSPKLSKSLNRIISNFGKKIINNKLNQLKEEFGIIVTEINPAYTSQTCSKCSYVDKRNRKNQETFICGFCHKKQNADINASKNILVRSSNELKDIFSKKSFILDKTVKCFIERHKVMLLFILKKDIGKSNSSNLSYNSLANTLTSNPYLNNSLNKEFLDKKAIPF